MRTELEVALSWKIPALKEVLGFFIPWNVVSLKHKNSTFSAAYFPNILQWLANNPFDQVDASLLDNLRMLPHRFQLMHLLVFLVLPLY